MHMVAVGEELAWLVAREKVRDCIFHIARGEDRRDGALIRSCYWPDAQLDFGIFQGSFEQYLAWIVPGSPAVPLTQHFLGQSLVAVEGERARAETHVLSYHRLALGDGSRDMVIGGRYLDRAERRDGEWRIAERTMLYDWYQELGPAVDWAKGLMGTPLAEAFRGQAAGDSSERWFARGTAAWRG
jgi:hypothetical protein